IVRSEFGQLDSKSDSNRQAYRKALHSLAILAI
ncbi:TetR/AcrR family transcriptional regulator, partial [Vibrio lentus]